MSWTPRGEIVVPIDFSDDSKQAVSIAVEMAGDPSRVHLVHVLFPLRNVSPAAVWGDYDDAHREASTREYFSAFLDDMQITGVQATILSGDPGLEIPAYAEKIDADLIIIPSHGYHGVKRFVLGSVAERVIRHASCSVFVVRRSDAE